MLISHTPISDGLKASSGCEMGSLWGVFMGFKAAGDFTGLGVPGTPGALLLFDPKSFERPKGAPVLGMGGWAAWKDWHYATRQLYSLQLRATLSNVKETPETAIP